MNFENMLHNLSNILVNGYKGQINEDPSLKQGQEYLQYEKNIKKEKMEIAELARIIRDMTGVKKEIYRPPIEEIHAQGSYYPPNSKYSELLKQYGLKEKDKMEIISETIEGHKIQLMNI